MDALIGAAARALAAGDTLGALNRVALRNDPLHALALPEAETTGTALYAKAAVTELLESREEALERMRRAGAVVLDVSPEVMTASVINRYLELKARGSI